MKIKKKILSLRKKLTEIGERESEREEFIRAIREGIAVEYVSCEPTENLKEVFPEEYGEEYEVPEDEETEQA